jgi:ankyrin repeat protein
MRPSIFTRPRHRQAYRLAAVVLVATACRFTLTRANAQSDDLISAAERGDLPAVNALLASHADVNVRKYLTHGSMRGTTTALLEASSHGHLEVVQALLAGKADVNAKRADVDNGDTAMTLAASNG